MNCIYPIAVLQMTR